MGYSIFSICTENYKDAFEFSVESWLNIKKVDQIVYYTDFDLNYCNDRVICHNILKPGMDWLEVVGLKAKILKRFAEDYNPEKFVFIDVDCYIKEDVYEVFDNDFDIAPTRLFHPLGANSGVWFCKKGDNIKKFAKHWMELQEQYKKNGIGVKSRQPSYSQKSFGFILESESKSPTYLKVHPLNKNIYNSEGDNIGRWIQEVEFYKPKIIHFKGLKFRYPAIVKEILK